MTQLLISSDALKKAVAFFMKLTSKEENAFNTFYLSWSTNGVWANFSEHSVYSRIRLADYDGDDAGDVALNVYLMSQIISRATSDDFIVTTNTSDSHVTIEHGKAKWDILKLYNSLTQPTFTPHVNDGVVVSGDVFSVTIRQVAPAADIGKVISNLQGVHLALDKGILTVEATDRYIAARHQFPVDSSGAWDVAVRASLLLSLARLTDPADTVCLTVDEGYLWITFGDVVVRLGVLAGNYPHLGAVFAQESTPVGTYGVHDLSAQVSLCQSVFERSEKLCPIACVFEPERLSFTSTGGYGAMKGECEPVQAGEGQSQLSISSKFLYSYLCLVKEETIDVRVGGKALFLGSGDKRAVIMGIQD